MHCLCIYIYMYSYAAWLTLYNKICQHKYYINFVNGYKQISFKYFTYTL